MLLFKLTLSTASVVQPAYPTVVLSQVMVLLMLFTVQPVPSVHM